MDVSTQASLRMNYGDLEFLLQYVRDPKLVENYRKYGNDWRFLGGTIPLVTTPFEAKGLVRSHKLFVADNARPMGIVDDDTAIPNPDTLPGYTNVLIKPNHLTTVMCPVRVEDRLEEMVKRGADGIAQAGSILLTRAAEQLMRRIDIWTHIGREGYVGRIASDPGTVDGSTGIGHIEDDTTQECFILWLTFLANDLYMPAFTEGAALQVAAPPAFGSPVVTLRNYEAPLRVARGVQIGYAAATTSYYRLQVLCPYTTSNKATVQTQLEAIAANDVVGLWCGATASAGTIGHGWQEGAALGRRFWSETDGSNVFQDVEDLGGAITIPLTTEQETQRSVNRNAGTGEWGHLNPFIQEGAGAAMSTASATILPWIQDIAQFFLVKTGKVPTLSIVVNPLMHAGMRAGVGVPSLVYNAQAVALAEKIQSHYGISGFVYQGDTSGPVVVGSHPAICPDEMVILNEGQGPLFEILAPEPPSWVTSAGSIWMRRVDGGQYRMGQIAVRKQTFQIFPRERLDDRLAVIRNITPGV